MSLVGPTGDPLYPRLEDDEDEDEVILTSAPGERFQANPYQMLMNMARRQRDGASHKAIIAEFDLVGEATSPFMLERALAVGRQMLDEAIAQGREPAESRLEATADG